MVPSLFRAASPGGEVILSGATEDEVDPVLEACSKRGAVPCERAARDGVVLSVFRAPC